MIRDEPNTQERQGKIIKQGTCYFCKGQYIVLQPTGGEVQVMHKKPLCEVFKGASAEDYRRFHDLNRHARRAAAAQMRKQQRKGGSGAVPKT